MNSFVDDREKLVMRQVLARGVRSPAVVAAFRAVRREDFVPPELAEFAYLDGALPIEKGQTISQPYIVAFMIEALELDSTDRVLEIGTGSGYAAALLGEIAREVFTIEWHAELAEKAADRLDSAGYDNVSVRHGDGTLGWEQESPFDAILVSAGGPEIPEPLKMQLAVGGRLVIPVGEGQTFQKLIRITRRSQSEFEQDELANVQFVPLVGTHGWRVDDDRLCEQVAAPKKATPEPLISSLIRETCDPILEIGAEAAKIAADRVGACRLTLIGEASHGTSEFYRMRAEITKELIQRGQCQFVAIEADWPDAAQVDDYVRNAAPRDNGQSPHAFSRFPTWMWRNREVLEFIDWLREYNSAIENPKQRIGFHGLDLYSMYTSIQAVLDYLERVDPASAEIARLRYGCLTPWESDAALYGRLAVSGRYRVCEDEAVAALQSLLDQRLKYVERDGEQFFNAVQNARLVSNAERYYRVMYYGSNESWNHRDRHMFESLEMLLAHYGKKSRAVLWEHNSHLGNAAHTEPGVGGQFNVGQLCQEKYGEDAYLIGQFTSEGTVAAASNWDEPVEIMNVRSAHPQSHEHIFQESRIDAFFLPFREPRSEDVREEFSVSRLERAIGVIYRPQTELASHYFRARIARQFDAVLWFNRTTAVDPILTKQATELGAGHPFYSS